MSGRLIRVEDSCKSRVPWVAPHPDTRSKLARCMLVVMVSTCTCLAENYLNDRELRLHAYVSLEIRVMRCPCVAS